MLLDHGHPNALAYPIWMIFAEADRVVRRLNFDHATRASLLLMALSSIPSMSVQPGATKKAAKDFQKHLKELFDGPS